MWGCGNKSMTNEWDIKCVQQGPAPSCEPFLAPRSSLASLSVHPAAPPLQACRHTCLSPVLAPRSPLQARQQVFFSQIGACRCVLALRSADQWPMAVQWPEANGSAVAYLRPMSLFLSATAPALSRPSRSMHCTMRLASALCFPLCLAVTSVTSLCFPVSPNMPRM